MVFPSERHALDGLFMAPKEKRYWRAPAYMLPEAINALDRNTAAIQQAPSMHVKDMKKQLIEQNDANKARLQERLMQGETGE